MTKKKVVAKKRPPVSEAEAVQAVATIKRYLDKKELTTRAEYLEAMQAHRVVSRHITEMAKAQRQLERARKPTTAQEKMLQKMLAESKIK